MYGLTPNDSRELCEPSEPRTIEERMAIAVAMGEDPLVGVIDDGLNGLCVIRNLSAPQIAADIRRLAELAKSGDMEAKEELRTMLMLHVPDLCFPGAAIVGMVRAAEAAKAAREAKETASTNQSEQE